MRLLADAWIVARRAVAEARRDRVAMTAQAIAYSLFLAIPASLFVLIGVFSLVADETLIDDLVVRARTVMPDQHVGPMIVVDVGDRDRVARFVASEPHHRPDVAHDQRRGPDGGACRADEAHGDEEHGHDRSTHRRRAYP